MTPAAIVACYQLNFLFCVLVKLDFIGGPVLVCNAASTFSWGGYNWLGLGDLGSIEAISEGNTLQMYGTRLTLSGVPSENISEALSQRYQGRPGCIWLAPLNDDYSFIADPVIVFKGRMDTMDVELGTTAKITLSLESRLTDWDRPKNRRYNDQDQQAEYPGDRAFKYVDQMISKDLRWGRK